jgi:hypothetical protein
VPVGTLSFVGVHFIYFLGWLCCFAILLHTKQSDRFAPPSISQCCLLLWLVFLLLPRATTCRRSSLRRQPEHGMPIILQLFSASVLPIFPQTCASTALSMMYSIQRIQSHLSLHVFMFLLWVTFFEMLSVLSHAPATHLTICMMKMFWTFSSLWYTVLGMFPACMRHYLMDPVLFRWHSLNMSTMQTSNQMYSA